MSTNLSHILALPEYRQTRQHIFPSQGSLDWFVRRHREALVEAGGLLMLGGRWMADAPKFDDAIGKIGQQLAKGSA